MQKWLNNHKFSLKTNKKCFIFIKGMFDGVQMRCYTKVDTRGGNVRMLFTKRQTLMITIDRNAYFEVSRV